MTTPAGVSGAVLLPPLQFSVLGTPVMAIAPTNLVYNIIATPGALYRYWRQRLTGGRLTVLLIAGTVPGVVVGCVGGIYGVGGGAALAPVLIAAGRPPSRAAPAALASTFVTSVVGVAFTVLAAHHLGCPPDWPTGILLGFGGLVGGMWRRGGSTGCPRR